MTGRPTGRARSWNGLRNIPTSRKRREKWGTRSFEVFVWCIIANCLRAGSEKRMPCGRRRITLRGDWLLFTDADVLFKPDSLRRALAYAESVPADHVVLFPQMIMKRPGEYMMIAFFQTMFMFGHRPWKVADPSTDDHMGVGAFNLVRRRVYDAVGTYEALRMEVLDDMKLGKVVKKAGYAQRNVLAEI